MLVWADPWLCCANMPAPNFSLDVEYSLSYTLPDFSFVEFGIGQIWAKIAGLASVPRVTVSKILNPQREAQRRLTDPCAAWWLVGRM